VAWTFNVGNKGKVSATKQARKGVLPEKNQELGIEGRKNVLLEERIP